MAIPLVLAICFVAFTTLGAARVVLTLGAVGTAFGVPPVFWINAAIMAATGFMSRRGSGASR